MTTGARRDNVRGSAGAGAQRWPGWLPEEARHYLAHVAGGRPIRALARDAQVHASTILRQVRRIEALRDDPLIDDALRDLARGLTPPDPAAEENAMSPHAQGAGTGPSAPVQPLTDARIAQEGARILRRLTETGTVLAVARDMDLGVVVRDGPDGEPQRIAVVERAIAQAMAIKDWIACSDPAARIARYVITAAGRQELRRMLGGGGGFAEAPLRFAGAEPEDDRTLRHMRSLLGESPVTTLARRQDKDGRPFLSRDLVAAAERLREDFELSNAGPRIAQDWIGFLASGASGGLPGGPRDGRLRPAAQDRLAAALGDLGPGLADVALRFCCCLEGLESIEARMGWSARSGKIVLRIALQRLIRHYEETQGRFAPKIG